MRSLLRWSVLAVALIALGSPLVEAQNKNKPKAKGNSASPQEYQQVLAAGALSGKITQIDHARRLITVQVEAQTVQPGNNQQGQNALRQQQQLARQMMQRRGNNRNPGQQARQVQQRAIQLQRQQAGNRNGGGPKIQTVRRDFQFQIDAKAQVRLMSLPQEFDERGKPRQYTAQELKELKGPNSSLPGYKSELESLAPGQTVKVHVASPKRAAPAAKPAKDADADVDVDLPALDPTRPRATLVLILKDEIGPTAGKDKPKKKNK